MGGLAFLRTRSSDAQERGMMIVRNRWKWIVPGSSNRHHARSEVLSLKGPERERRWDRDPQ